MNNHAWKKTLYIHNTLKLKTHSLKNPSASTPLAQPVKGMAPLL
jgi:hypothetical protein